MPIGAAILAIALAASSSPASQPAGTPAAPSAGQAPPAGPGAARPQGPPQEQPAAQTRRLAQDQQAVQASDPQLAQAQGRTQEQPVQAQGLTQQPLRSMTLPEALAYARKNQPSLAAARARLSGSEAAANVPRALYEPRLALTAQVFEGTANNSTATYLGVGGLDLPRIGATEAQTSGWDPSASTLVAIGVRQEIFDFGRIAALRAVADAAVEAERGRADAARLDVDYAVETAFFAVRAAVRVRAAAAAALQRSRLNFETAAAGVKAELRDPIELTRAEADMGRFEVGLVRAEAGLAAARSTFAAIVGVPDPALDAGGQPLALSPVPTLQDALAQAVAQDPVLRARRALVVEQRASTRSIAAELRPDLSLTSTLSSRAGGASPTGGAEVSGDGWVPNVPNWDAGLVLSWSLFDGGVRAREEASRALQAARAAEVEERKQQLSAAVQRAYVDYSAAVDALPPLEKSQEAARANYAQAEARFKAELGTSVELADAQALLTQADVGLAVGRFEAYRARAVLGRAVAEEL